MFNEVDMELLKVVRDIPEFSKELEFVFTWASSNDIIPDYEKGLAVAALQEAMDKTHALYMALNPNDHDKKINHVKLNTKTLNYKKINTFS